MQTNRRIDGKRLWDSLMAMAEIGATPKGGVRRLALSEVDRAGRDRFRAQFVAPLVAEADKLGISADQLVSMIHEAAPMEGAAR